MDVRLQRSSIVMFKCLLLLLLTNAQQVLSQQLNLPMGVINFDDDCDGGISSVGGDVQMLGGFPGFSPSSREVHCVGGGYFVGMRVVYTTFGSLQIAQLHCASGNMNIEGVGRMQYPFMFKFATMGEEQDMNCPYGFGVSGLGGTVDAREMIVGVTLHCTNLTDQFDTVNTTFGYVQDSTDLDICANHNEWSVSLVKSFLVSFELDMMGYQSQNNWMYSIGINTCMNMYDLHQKAPQLIKQCDSECLDSANFPHAACQWERIAYDRLNPPDCSHSIIGCQCNMTDWIDSYGMKHQGGCVRLKEGGISRCPVDLTTCPKTASMADVKIEHDRVFDFCYQSCNELIKPLDEILYDQEDLSQYSQFCSEDMEVLNSWVQLKIGYKSQHEDGRSGWTSIKSPSPSNSEQEGEQSSNNNQNMIELCLTVQISPHLGSQPYLAVEECTKNNKNDKAFRSELFRKVRIQRGGISFNTLETAQFPGLCLFARGLMQCSKLTEGLQWDDTTHILYECWQLYLSSVSGGSSSTNSRVGGGRQAMSVVPFSAADQLQGQEVMLPMCSLLRSQSADALGYVDNTFLSIMLVTIDYDYVVTPHQVEAQEVLEDVINVPYNQCDHRNGVLPEYCNQEDIVCDHLGRVVYLSKGEPANNLLQLSRLRAAVFAHSNLRGHFPNFQIPQQGRSNLTVLILKGNKFTGTLPLNWAFSLENIKYLDLRQNLVIGEIPQLWSWKSIFQPQTQIKLDYSYLCQQPPINASLRFVDIQEIPGCKCESTSSSIQTQYYYQVSLHIYYPLEVINTSQQQFRQSQFVTPISESIDFDLEQQEQECTKLIDCEGLMCEEVRWMQQWHELEELNYLGDDSCGGGMNPFWVSCQTEQNYSNIVEQSREWEGSVKTLFGDLNLVYGRGMTRRLLQQTQGVYMLQSVAGLYSLRDDLESGVGLNQLSSVVVGWFSENNSQAMEDSLAGLLRVHLVEEILHETNKPEEESKIVTIIAAVIAVMATFLLLGVFVILYRKRRSRNISKSKSGESMGSQLTAAGSQHNRTVINSSPQYNHDFYMPNTIHFVSEDQQVTPTNIQTPRCPDIDFNIDFEKDLDLDKKLGQDEFGVVYLGQWKDKSGNSHEVVIKVIETGKFNKCENSDIVAVIREELKSTCLVHHPCLVQYYGGSFQQDRIAIVSEYIDGWTLEEYIHGCGNRLSVRQVLQILRSVSRALAYLHPTIIHQAIQPATILLSKQGVVKLTDYGLSNVRQTMGSCAGLPFSAASPYEAPEVLRNANDSWVATEKADIYALGILVWEMCTGQKPCQELESRLQLLLKIGYEKYRPPLPRDSAPILLDVMTQCWHEDPKLRPSATEIFRQTDFFLRSKSDSELLRVPSPQDGSFQPSPKVQTPEQFLEALPEIEEEEENEINEIFEEILEEDQLEKVDIHRSFTGSTSNVPPPNGHYQGTKQQHCESPPRGKQAQKDSIVREQAHSPQKIAVQNYFTGLDGSSIGENSINVALPKRRQGVERERERGDGSCNRKGGNAAGQVELLNLGNLKNREQTT